MNELKIEGWVITRKPCGYWEADGPSGEHSARVDGDGLHLSHETSYAGDEPDWAQIVPLAVVKRLIEIYESEGR